MTTDPIPGDLAAAVAAFAEALDVDRLLAATARVETTVRAPGALEPLRRAEAAFEAAWPSGPRPAHELVWALQASGPGPAVSLRAYDHRGRLLLSRQYAAAELESGHG
jgi:hypothetical protein